MFIWLDYLLRHESINLCYNKKLFVTANAQSFFVLDENKKTYVMLSFYLWRFTVEPGGSDDITSLRPRYRRCDRMRRKLHRSFLRESLRKRRKELKIQKVGLVENILPLAYAHIYLIHRPCYTYHAFSNVKNHSAWSD